MAGMNLVEMAKTYDQPIKRAIVMIYANSSALMRVLPFENVLGGGLRYNVEEALPGIGFRGINENWTASVGLVNPEFEPLVIGGGELKFDSHLLRTQGRARQTSETERKVTALGLRFTSAFINGDSSTDPRVFDGLARRLRGRQVISAGTTSGGAALSLKKLDALKRLVQRPTHYVMSGAMADLIAAAARDTTVSGFVKWEPDAFGNKVMHWGGLPIIELDRDGANDYILDFDEASFTGAATSTSIYCVSFGSGMCHGIQSGTPEVDDLGKMESAPAELIRLEWDTGVATEHPHSAARLQHIGNLDVVK